MIVNETSFHWCSNEMDVSNMGNRTTFSKKSTYSIVDYKRSWHEKCELYQTRKMHGIIYEKTIYKNQMSTLWITNPNHSDIRQALYKGPT